jgi:hypothetical protein
MRLSPRFVEFMMGLPLGWVTDVPGLSRTEQLKALGNGVVPQQCALAVRQLLDVLTGMANPVSIDEEARLLPTPQVMDGRRRARSPEEIAEARKGGGCANLREAIFEPLPTPRSTRGGSGTELMYRFGGTRSDHGRPQGEVLL